MTSLSERFETRMGALTQQAHRLEERYANLLSRETELQQELVDLDDELEVLKQVSELFKHLIERHVHDYAENFSKLVTEGLQAIYYDQDLTFRIEVTQKRGKVHVEFLTEQGGRAGAPLESFGGGVASIESLLLRLLVLLKAKQARYLFLDESLAALSVEYVDTCGEFLRRLCERLGVHVLLVTHNEGFLEHATHAYKGRMGTDGSLVLEHIKE